MPKPPMMALTTNRLVKPFVQILAPVVMRKSGAVNERVLRKLAAPEASPASLERSAACSSRAAARSAGLGSGKVGSVQSSPISGAFDAGGAAGSDGCEMRAGGAASASGCVMREGGEGGSTEGCATLAGVPGASVAGVGVGGAGVGGADSIAIGKGRLGSGSGFD